MLMRFLTGLSASQTDVFNLNNGLANYQTLACNFLLQNF